MSLLISVKQRIRDQHPATKTPKTTPSDTLRMALVAFDEHINKLF